MAYIGKQPVVGNFQVCDAISVVNGQAAYTMQVGSTNVEPENANHMLVSLNGVLQKPGSSFTISGATITFASNLATGDVIDFIILLGDTLNVGTPSDNTVTTAKLSDSSVSLAKLTATGTKSSSTFLRGDNSFAVPSGGKVLQAVSVLNNTESNTTSGSYQTTGLTANITPSATSSKVLAIASFAAQGDGGAPAYTLYNGSAYASGSSGRGLCNFEQTGKLTNCGFNFLDSPSSTSQVTYTVVMKNNTAGQNAIIAPGAAYGHLTLLEIGA